MPVSILGRDTGHPVVFRGFLQFIKANTGIWVKLSLRLSKYHAIKTYGGSDVIAPCISNLDTRLEVNGHLHAPAVLPPV
jgi:hypothetical protein